MLIKLTKEEYCLFSDQTKIIILDNHGRLICVHKLSDHLELRIYYLFDFLVETTNTVAQSRTIRVQLFTGSKDLLDLLQGDLV
jgi:hypothetical protein